MRVLNCMDKDYSVFIGELTEDNLQKGLLCVNKYILDNRFLDLSLDYVSTYNKEVKTSKVSNIIDFKVNNYKTEQGKFGEIVLIYKNILTENVDMRVHLEFENISNELKSKSLKDYILGLFY